MSWRVAARALTHRGERIGVGEDLASREVRGGAAGVGLGGCVGAGLPPGEAELAVERREAFGERW